MKKTILLAMFGLFTAVANAQISVTPHVGVGYSKLSKTSSDYDEFAKHMIGVEAMYEVNEKLAVSVGADYSALNSDTKKETTIYIGGLTAKYQAHLMMGILDIPVLAQYNITSHLSAKAGIQPSFIVKADAGLGSVKKAYNTTQFSIPVGASWKFNSPLVLSAQYNFPLTKIADGSDSKLSTVTVSLGYRFGL